MLGTLEDADDAWQETLLRAWRQIARFEPRAPLRAWIYRIATNVCLTMLTQRARRGEVAASTVVDAPVPEGELMHLDPYPDRYLDELTAGPEETVERRESIELAFVAAVQMLPPRQRAALLLRDVIGYPAAEVASMLETSVAAVNSALQRARDTVVRERVAGAVSRTHDAPGSATEDALVRQLVAAWHAADVPSIVAILTADALFAMPPQPRRLVGHTAIATFLSTAPAHGRLDRFRLIPTRANRQPALAAYWRDSDVGPYRAHGLIVVACAGDAIASLTRFGDTSLFEQFGLPLTIEDQVTLTPAASRPAGARQLR